MSNLRNRLPPLGTLAAFEAACRHGSFTRAAAELNLTQAAVSRQIRLLEDHLGVSLFERRRRNVALTADGAVFAKQVNPALIQIGDAASSFRLGGSELTICTELCIAAHWLMPRLSRFQTAQPHLKLRIVTSSNPIDVGETGFDVALAYGVSHQPGMRSDPLVADSIISLCSPSLRATLPATCTAEDIAPCDLLHCDDGGRSRMDWARFLAAFEVVPLRPSRLVFTTYNNALDAAMQGLGIVLGWRSAVHLPIMDGRLVEIEGFSLPSPDPLSAHFPARRRLSAATERFIAWVREELHGTRSEARRVHVRG